MSDLFVPKAVMARIADGTLSTEDAAQVMLRGMNAPTRLDSRPGQPDFDPVWAPRVRGVFVNGREVGAAVRFDITEGWAEGLELDDQNKVVETAGIAPVHRVYGKVEVRYAIPRQ